MTTISPYARSGRLSTLCSEMPTCNYTSHKGYVSHVYPMIVSHHIHLYLPIQMAGFFY